MYVFLGIYIYIYLYFLDYMDHIYTYINIHILVGGLEHLDYFPYIGKNHRNWLSYFSMLRSPSFFRGVGIPPTSSNIRIIMEDLAPISHFSPNIGGFIYGDWSSSHRHMAKNYQSCKNWGSSKPIGSMVLLYMVTLIPSICPQLAYIPAPWILWEILSVFFFCFCPLGWCKDWNPNWPSRPWWTYWN